ncbi:MAG: family 43 glycosylhydrolase, partial [Lachnospiraceae bacterium]|nr:family 43 glycosylhydrolase [Lachnospiraceae bacterium]
MVVGDTMYLITSHDEDEIEGGFFTMKNWNCYSSTDMVNWTDHGTIFGQTSFEWGHISDFRAWAPQCVERGGKFYLYVPLLRKGANDEAGSPGYGIGVAVADNPAGPYEDAIGGPLIEGDWYDIDPTVFVDDDGQAYLYYGQNLKYVKLNDDMISYDKSIGDKGKVSVSVPNYVEGPWLTKHNNIYYFMYAGTDEGASSTHQAYETLRYAYSDSPEGPWTYGGILMETTVGHSYTNHPGVADFKGHSYLFYHTDQLKDGGGYHRSVCVSEFTYNSDGTIDLVPMVDSVDPIGTLNPYKRVEAETICYADGTDEKKLNVKTELVGTDDLRVTHLNEGDYIKIREVDFGSAGAVKFSASVAAAQSGGSFDICLDSIDGDIIGTLDVPQTGEDVFKVVDIDVKKTTGIHDLYFAFHTANDDDMFKFDYWQFTEEVTVTPSPSPQPPVATVQPPAQTPQPQPPVTDVK